MTSLQQQLAVIAANSTHQLDLKAQRASHSKSLLFDAQVAVTQDFNTIYQICYEGFEELCSLDNRFVEYADSLFSEQAKSEEREQWTAEQNKDLDSVLEGFLILVGGRLLLKPAQKAVEWLIRRFRIHEYNTQCLILTFLPYHSTPLFLALLSIIPRQLTPTFRFLYPYMTALSNPPVTAIIHSATTNTSFFSALSRYVVKSAQTGHVYSVLLSFWTSIASQAVEGMIHAAQSGRTAVQDQKVEELLLLVLPILSDALALKNTAALTEACCTIITVLAAKAPLADHVLDGLMEAVSSSWPDATTDVRLTCLAILAQRRDSKRLSKPVIKRLLLLPDSASRISKLSKDYRVDRLASGHALGCVARFAKANDDKEIITVKRLLEAGIMTDKQARAVLTATVKQATNAQDLQQNQRQSMAELLMFAAGSEQLQEAWRYSLEKSELDVSALEDRLNVKMPQSIQVTDAMEIEDRPTDSLGALPATESSHDALQTLRNLDSEPRTFMAPASWEDLALLSSHFTQLVNSSPSALTLDHEFLRLPVLRQDSLLKDPTFASFLLRLISGNQQPRIKVTALRLIGDALKDVFRSEDVQDILLPYLVAALSDGSQSVRRAAAGIVKELALLNEERGQHQHIAWHAKELYPIHTSKYCFPEEKDIHKLWDLISPHLEACVLDAAVLPKLLHDALCEDPLHSSAIPELLAWSAIASPDVPMQLRLLQLIASPDNIDHETTRRVVKPFFEEYVRLPPADVKARCEEDGALLEDITETIVSLSSDYAIFGEIVVGKVAGSRHDVQAATCKRLKKIWKEYDQKEQENLAFLLLDAATSPATDNDATRRRNLALETLPDLKLSTGVLSYLLDALPNAVEMADKPPATKRRRTSRSEMARADVLDEGSLAQALRKYTVTLELVAGSDPRSHPELLKPLFNCFGEIQHYKTQADSGLVYLQGLVIDSLLAIVNQLRDSKQAPADTSAIRADLLVDCLRHTPSSQVQSSALLLISALASWVPDVVLHNVMPIFTFMGSTILRQSDDYSAHVIDQTVSKVLPPLAASLRKSSRRVLAGVADLLQSFVAAFEHMPLHRRLGLFEKVIRALGPADCLFAAMVMLVDRYPTDDHVGGFLADLLCQFDAQTQFSAFEQYVVLLLDMQKPRRDVSDLVLGLKDKPKDDISAITATLLAALSDLLHSARIRFRIAKAFTNDSDAVEEQRRHFANLVQNSVRITQVLDKRDGLHEAAQRLLSNVFNLLPLRELLRSALPLLNQSENAVRSVLLYSITEQCRHHKANDQGEKWALLEFVSVVADAIQKTDDAALKRAAIACIDQITERFGKADTTSQIFSAARVISSPHALGSADASVRSLSLVCLATMVEVLGDDFVALVPQVSSQTLDYLEEGIEKTTANPTLHNACFALINAIIEYIPFVYGGKLLDRSIELAQKSGNSPVASTVADSRLQFYELLARKDASEIFPALKRNSTVDHLNLEYLDFAKAVVEHQKKSSVVRNSSPLFDFLLQGFDCRRNVLDLGKGIHEEYMDKIETAFIEIAVATVMKLNDATFRPFFIRLVDWVNALGKGDSSGKGLRATALFQFFAALSANLKSLLTSYSAYILDLAAELLQTTDSKDDYADRMLTYLLAALYQSFEHDEDDFWQSPAHFEIICTPLLSRLSRSSKSMLKDAVIPSISAFAAAAGSSDHHKAINVELLKFMRSDSKHTRLAAVKCEHAITDRLGEDWLNLLSEMLPMIRELLEDDDEEVEKETRRWVKRVEEILGENLDGMLE